MHRPRIGEHLDEFTNPGGRCVPHRCIGITEGVEQGGGVAVAERLGQHVHGGAPHSRVDVGQEGTELVDRR